MRASLVEQHGRIHGRIKVANASRSSISVLASQSTEAWRCRCGDIRMCGPCLAFIRVTGLGLGGAGHAGEASRLGCLPPKLPPHATQARSQAKPACFASLPCHTGFSHPLLLAAQRRTRPPATSPAAPPTHHAVFATLSESLSMLHAARAYRRAPAPRSAPRPAPRPLPNPVIENIGPISPPRPRPRKSPPDPAPARSPATPPARVARIQPRRCAGGAGLTRMRCAERRVSGRRGMSPCETREQEQGQLRCTGSARAPRRR